MRPYTVVKSLAGRDKGEWFVIVSIDGEFAFIANGKSRPLNRLKKKRIRHLAKSTAVLVENDLATDRKLRFALRNIAADHDKGGE